MRSDDEVREAFRLADSGLSRAAIARRIGISRATVRDWLDHGEAAVLNRLMRKKVARARSALRCAGSCLADRSLDGPPYAYLLGQYLGDGRITSVGASHRLRITCCDAYPDIMAECADSIRVNAPGTQVRTIARVGCTEVYSAWGHWPCLLPQHGPGRNHERTIALEPWQRSIVLDQHPDRFVRGLIHSDGWRGINRVTVRGKRYAYVRYMFSNRSLDIHALFLAACERLGVEARRNSAVSSSVAKRASVAKLEAIVGPKT